jgi:nickel/cobalt transporter (NiCoT) family protein
MQQRGHVAGLAVGVAALQVLGWGLYLAYARGDPKLAGLGALAYALGLRHAFDVDHLAAIDNTTRNLLARGRSSAGVGFFFSLGHSAVVVGLVALVVGAGLPSSTLGRLGGPAGVGVSATFLLLIGLLNFGVLLDRSGEQKGFVSRLGLARLFRLVGRSWHAFPIGALFAVGFDTVSEVALLALAAGASAGLPLLGALVLPLLFAAGMVLLDTADGVLMSAAYGWATAEPGRRMRMNIALTALSVAVAFSAGLYEATRVGSPVFTYGLLILLTAAAAAIVARAQLGDRVEPQSSRSTG